MDSRQMAAEFFGPPRRSHETSPARSRTVFWTGAGSSYPMAPRSNPGEVTRWENEGGSTGRVG